MVTGGLAVRPSFGATLGGLRDSRGAERMSRFGSSLFVVHTDLHNHSFVSGDAEGLPADALDQIREQGIDVACMTEHAVSGKGHGQYTCPTWQDGGCRFAEGINENDWQTMKNIADNAYVPDRFVTFRGFEYSTPTVGHINVWFGEDFTDPAHEMALATPRALSEMWRIFGSPTKPVADQFKNAPDTALIAPFYDWLSSSPGSLPFGGGNDALASFNHPGYFGNFQDFEYHVGAAPHMVLMEAFNSITYPDGQRNDQNNATDYFWYRRGEIPQPFNACFNAGWRVGFTGVSDEHSGSFGQAGKGRGGLWVSELTRSGVRRAMLTRRSFATVEAGLRLDAMANGMPMGSSMPAPNGPVTITVDIDRGPGWDGKTVYVQIIGPGATDPTLLDVKAISFPTAGPVSFEAMPNGSWMFLRFVDPDRLQDQIGRDSGTDFEKLGGAFAYASPWFFASA